MNDRPPNRAALLDRDGTLIEDPGYLGDPDGVVLLPGAATALRQLREAGFFLILITNQSGVGRGFYTEQDLRAVHERLIMLLKQEHVTLDALYYCPHKPDDACDCRKPHPGLFRRAQLEFNLDLARSVTFGDKSRDLEAGREAGVGTCIAIGEPLPGADAWAPSLDAAVSAFLERNHNI